jgi:hypothetical protein
MENNNYPLGAFSKLFADRYGIDHSEYVRGALLDSEESYREFLKLSGHWMEENLVNGIPNLDPSVEIIEDALVAYFEPNKKKVIYKDIFNKYKFNSSGYRMPKEITGTEEFLFSGCSHTVGEGAPQEMVWGVQVANSLNISWANLAMSGRSPVWSVDNIFGYLSKYNAKPKIIALLLPEFDRFQVVNNPLAMISKQTGASKKEVMNHGFRLANIFGSHYVTNPKFSERPHWAEDVLNAETSFMYNIRAVKNLAMYCKAAGIKFVWSTWSRDDYLLLSQYKEELGIADTFVEIESLNWYSYPEKGWIDEYHTKGFLLEAARYSKNPDEYHHLKCSDPTLENNMGCVVTECHSDLKEKYGWNFDIGTDKHMEPEHSHFGVHKHTHFAEKFTEALID